jgi:hypothetical protein
MMSARGTHKVPCVQFAFSDDTVLSESLSERQLRDFTQTEPDAPSWVQRTKGGLSTSGRGKFIAHEMGMNVE